MEPANRIITALGGPTAVAAIVGVHRTTPWKWTQPKASGGTDGLIPRDHIKPLLAVSRQRGLGITVEDFLGLDSGA